MLRRVAKLLLSLTAAGLLTLPLAAQQTQQATAAPLRGDVDGDGKVTVADARAVISFVVGRPVPPSFTFFPNGDADGDGRVTTTDAAIIMGYASGRDVARYPVGAAVDQDPGRLGILTCNGDIRNRRVTCGTQSPQNPQAAAHNLIVGGQNLYVTLASSNIAVTADTFAFDVAVTNLIPQAMGTLDGSTLDSIGVRVFFHDGPTATVGVGTMEVANEEGTKTFTGSNQPFYQWDEILAANGGSTSGVERFKLRFDPGVTNFQFKVYVATSVQFPNGWVDIYPPAHAPSPTAEYADTLRAGQTLQLEDTVRNAVGKPLNISATWGSSNPGVATVDTNTGLVTAVADGSTVITATGNAGRTGTYHIVVSTPSPAQTHVVANPTTLTVGDTSLITVQVENGAGQNITEGGDNVQLSSDGGTLSAVTDHGDGSYTATLTTTLSSVIKVTGTLNAAQLDTATVTFTSDTAVSMTKTAGDGQTATAGTDVPIDPQVRLVDGLGNGVPGVSVTFAPVGSTNGSVTGGTTTTDASGYASVGSWTLATTAKVDSLTATAGSFTVTFTATGVAGAPANMVISAGDGQTATAGSDVAVDPAVTITDANGNPVSGVSVTFTPASGGGSVTGSPATTDAAGVATVGSWTLGTTAGANTLDASSPGLTTVTFNATGVAGAPANMVKSAGDAQTADAGSAVTVDPAVTITDANGNPVSGVSVTFAVTGGGGSVTGSPAVTDAAGVATVGSWTLGTVAGANTLDASATGLTTVTFTATGEPGPPVNMVKSAGDAQSATVNTAVAIDPAVTVTDQYGNGVPGVSVTFTPSAGGSVTGSPAVTNASGVATVGSWTLSTVAGGNTLDASATGLTTVTFSATGTPDVPASITKTAGDLQNGTVGAAVAVDPAVHVEDQYGNDVPGVTITFAVTGGGGSVGGGTPTTNATGDAAVGSWTLGSGPTTNTLQASATPAGTSTPVTFTAYVPPTAGADSSQAMGNTTVSSSVAPNVLANDATINGSPLSITTLGALPTVRGGTVTLAANGTFSYLPPAGNVLRDSVEYTINDTHLSSNGWIKLRFVGKVWHVDNTFGGAADGRDVSPYTSISAAEAVAGVNDTILVRTGSGTTTGGTLKNGQLLRGQGHSAAFTTTLNGFSVTLLATGTRPDVGGLTLGSGNTLRGMRVVNGAGAGLTGASVGTMSFTEGSVHATGGPALNLASGTATITVDSLRSTNSTTSGISLSSVAGTVTINGGTASTITGPTGAAVSISGSNPTFTFPGTISKTNAAGAGISLTSLTGGSVSFTGPSVVLSTGSGAGITATGTATVSFVDSVKVTTTSGAGITASGGGTLTIAGTRNSITSGTGTALNVNGTTIGAGGLHFRSISASGGANGISLTNTGTSGALTVTGDGSTNGSGGTITNTAGADGATSGNGIYLNNTRNVNLSWMALSGHANNGLYGTGVRGLTMNKMRFTGTNGNSNSGTFDESAVSLVDVGGAVKVTNSRFDGGAYNAFRVENISGTAPTLDSLVVANDTVENMQGSTVDVRGTALLVSLQDGTADVRIRDSRVTYWWANGIHVLIQGTASGTSRITNNFVDNTNGALAGAGGIGVIGGNHAYNISGNTVRHTNGAAISADRVNFGTNMNGTISGNTIGVAGDNNSGSAAGAGIFASHHGPGTTTTRIANNTIRQVTGNAAGVIWLLTGDAPGFGGSGTFNATVVGNDMQQTGSPSLAAHMGILATVGTTSGPPNDTDQACLDIGGSTAALRNSITNINTGFGFAATSENRMRVNQRFGTTSRFPGYAGTQLGATSQTDLAAYLLGRNTASNSTNANTSTGGFNNTSPAGSACPQPTI